MGTVDLVIKNGDVCTPYGAMRVGVAVDEGRIVALAKESMLPDADRVLDASGKHVLPGLVDAHTHIRDPGYTRKEDYTTGTMAAAAGGVTVIMPQPNTDPVPNTLERYLEHIAMAEKKALIDFNVMPSPLVIGEIPKLAEAGTVNFKIFQKTAAYPYDTEASTANTGRIYEVFKAVAKTGLSCSVHPHNHDVYTHVMNDLKRRGEFDAEMFVKATMTPEVWESAAVMLCYLAEQAGVRWYALHCIFPGYIETVRRAKARRQDIIADAMYFALVPPKLNRPYPEREEGFDALRDHIPIYQEMSDACWRGILDGAIDFVTTDHAPHLREEVLIGREDAGKMALGYEGLEVYLSILLSEVAKGRLPLEKLVQLCSENPAKAFNLYPRKGAIEVGSDADIVIVDMKKKGIIRSDKLYTRCGWTPYDGREVQGVPIYTIMHGEVIMEDGGVTGKPGHGRFVKPQRPSAKGVP